MIYICEERKGFVCNRSRILKKTHYHTIDIGYLALIFRFREFPFLIRYEGYTLIRNLQYVAVNCHYTSHRITMHVLPWTADIKIQMTNFYLSSGCWQLQKFLVANLWLSSIEYEIHIVIRCVPLEPHTV